MRLPFFFSGGITPGTTRANKALVPDSNKRLDTLDLTELKLGGTAITATAAELNAVGGGGIIEMTRAALAAAGTTAADAAVIATQVVAVTASDGTKGVALPAAATTVGPILVINTVLTTGASLKVYPVRGGNDNINGGAEDVEFLMGPGEAAWFIPTSATQWYVADHSGNLLTKTEINLLVGLLATAAEINRACDVSTRIVNLDATSLAITELLHSDKIVKLSHTAAASTCTLPDATGSGALFRFVVGAVNVNNHVVKVPDANNVFRGSVNILDNDANAQTAYAASGTDDTLTLNGTTTGGAVGDWVEFLDIAADTWAVRGGLVVPAGSNVADPFSATV